MLRKHDSGRRRSARSPSTIEAVGAEPRDYGSKLAPPLHRQMSAGEAVMFICGRLLDAMNANEQGVQRDADSKFLHDFRVAVRRTRSALALMEQAFEPEARDHFRDEFKWLGSITGTVRDLDVYLLQMNEYRARLPEARQKDLAPLGHYLRGHRSSECRRLSAALRSKRYRALAAEWRGYLDGPLPDASRAPLAQRQVLDVASQRIWRAYRKVKKRGRAISVESPAESLHDLRIECKKLRYLLEFFQSLYAPDEVEPLVKALKQLQNNLGEFNDLEVQQATLQRFAHDMEEEGIASVDCLLAMGRLLTRQDRQQCKERRRFADCFSQFDSVANRERYRRLFKVPSGFRG